MYINSHLQAPSKATLGLACMTVSVLLRIPKSDLRRVFNRNRMRQAITYLIGLNLKINTYGDEMSWSELKCSTSANFSP